MSALQKPWVAGALAGVALVAIGLSVGWPKLKSLRTKAKATETAKSGPKPARTNAPAARKDPAVAQSVVPEAPVDSRYVAERFSQWVESPSRDPFKVFAGTVLNGEARPASDYLTLKAIWRQTGGKLAVLNSQVCMEGEEIQGYRVDQIDSDQIWVVGPLGRESLDFRPKAPSASRTNAPGAAKRAATAAKR